MKFTSGSQHRSFESNNCFDCLNYRSVDNKKPLCKCTNKDDEGGFGCVLTDVHFLYQDQVMNEVLDLLLPPDGICNMRLTINEVKDEADKILLKQNLELQQKIYNLKKGYNQLSFTDQMPEVVR